MKWLKLSKTTTLKNYGFKKNQNSKEKLLYLFSREKSRLLMLKRLQKPKIKSKTRLNFMKKFLILKKFSLRKWLIKFKDLPLNRNEYFFFFFKF